MPYLSRRKLLFASSSLAIAGLAHFRFATGATGPTPIKIANAAGGLNLTMGELMRQQGFLESFGLAPDVLAVADGSKILGAVVSGSVDASLMSGFGQVFPAIAQGAAIKILAGGAVIPMLALFSSKPDVKTLKDLEGRTVGTASIGALIYQLTVALLQKYQVDVAKVRFVNIGSSADIFRAVSAGTVDAGAAESGLIDEAADYHVHLIDHGNMAVELPEFTFQGAWATDGKIATEREALVRTLAAYAKLYRFVHTPEAETAFIRARRSVFPNAAQRDHEVQWKYIQAYKPFAVNLILSPERLRYMQELNVSFKVQTAILPFERTADMSLAADAVKLLGSAGRA
jgi:NitT/TauT family transport system substrate-binding protein